VKKKKETARGKEKISANPGEGPGFSSCCPPLSTEKERKKGTGA